jgi:hypothetical protein
MAARSATMTPRISVESVSIKPTVAAAPRNTKVVMRKIVASRRDIIA